MRDIAHQAGWIVDSDGCFHLSRRILRYTNWSLTHRGDVHDVPLLHLRAVVPAGTCHKVMNA
jgi:hypothetical protein